MAEHVVLLELRKMAACGELRSDGVALGFGADRRGSARIGAPGVASGSSHARRHA